MTEVYLTKLDPWNYKRTNQPFQICSHLKDNCNGRPDPNGGGHLSLNSLQSWLRLFYRPTIGQGQQCLPFQGNSFQNCTTRRRITDNIKGWGRRPKEEPKSRDTTLWRLFLQRNPMEFCPRTNIRKRLFLHTSYKSMEFFDASPDFAPKREWKTA